MNIPFKNNTSPALMFQKEEIAGVTRILFKTIISNKSSF